MNLTFDPVTLGIVAYIAKRFWEKLDTLEDELAKAKSDIRVILDRGKRLRKEDGGSNDETFQV